MPQRAVLRMVRRLMLILICALAVFSTRPNGVFAEETSPRAPDLKKLSLEELMDLEVQTVYSASKHEQKITEAPSSVTIITSADFKKYGYRTLADALRSVRGFYVTNDRNYSYVGVRGFGRPGDYNSRILLLIDGHRTNDNIYDQAFVGTEGLLDVDLIDRVEIVRGPGSSLYGNNAFFAVVNVITRKGRDLKGVEASGEAASYDTYKERLSYGDSYRNGLEAIISGTGYGSRGRQLSFPEISANNGMTNGTDYDRFNSFFGKASLGDFTLEGATVERTKGIPTGAFATDFNDPGNKTTDGHSYVDVKYDRDLGGRTELAARAYADYYWYEGHYVYGGVLDKDLGDGAWWGGEVKLSTRLFEVHRIVAGAEYTDNARQDQKYYTVEPYALLFDDRRRSEAWAAYLQDELTLSSRTALNAGVRYDHYSEFGGTTNPRLAFIFTPTERSALKILFGAAFRIPNDFERYYATPGTNVPNPALKPEKITTYELVYEKYLGGGLRFSVSGYYYRITDFIDQVDTGAGTQYVNLDEVAARGGELELDKKWPNGVDGRLNYTLQRAERTLTGEPLQNSPEQSAKLNVSAPIVREKVYAGVEEQYTGRRRTLGGNYTAGYFITNVTLFTPKLIDGLELSASVYNLLNQTYRDPVSADLLPLDTVQQDGLTYRLKLTYGF